jgi:hypothetical protein
MRKGVRKMEINNKNMCNNEVRKVGLLITEASRLGMDVSGYGMADVNQNSGNVYLWLEDYPACLYIGLSGDDEIYACYSDPEDGEEFETTTDDWSSVDDMYEWVDSIVENKKQGA